MPTDACTHLVSAVYHPRQRARGATRLAAILGLFALVGCAGVEIGPPSFPSCPPSCHAGGNR